MKVESWNQGPGSFGVPPFIVKLLLKAKGKLLTSSNPNLQENVLRLHEQVKGYQIRKANQAWNIN